MLRGVMIFGLALSAAAATAAPANLIVEASGPVFVARTGETQSVTELPFTLEEGDVITVGPGGQATLPATEGGEATILTIDNSPFTVSETNPLIATLLTASGAETARVGGADFSTMRGAVLLSQQLQSPRNTALLESPEEFVVALPDPVIADFLDHSEADALTAEFVLGVYGGDVPLFTQELRWTREELGQHHAAGESEMLTLPVTPNVEIVPGERMVVAIISREIQRIAMEIDATQSPPLDRAWFRILADDARAAYESDLQRTAELIALSHAQGSPETDLWTARVMLSHEMNGEALAFLNTKINAHPDGASSEAVASLRALRESLAHQIDTVWTPPEQ